MGLLQYNGVIIFSDLLNPITDHSYYERRSCRFVDLIQTYHMQHILSTTTKAQSPSEEAKCSSKTAFAFPFLSAHPHKRLKHSLSEGLFIL